MSASLKFSRRWLEQKSINEIDATMAEFAIHFRDLKLTSYSSQSEAPGEALNIPLYYLAEWMAENWWALLWEPRKTDDYLEENKYSAELDSAEEEDYFLRHLICTAEHGFPLPHILFQPSGNEILVSARSRYVRFADVRFDKGASGVLPRKDIESELRNFVSTTCRHLDELGISQTTLQEAWNFVESTRDDEQEYCQYVGALGLSPYVEHVGLDARLDDLVNKIGSEAVMDLCLGSTPKGFKNSATLAEESFEILSQSNSVATLAPLQRIAVPAENIHLPAYRRGTAAAKRIRGDLGISDADPAGAVKIFELMNLDTKSRTTVPKERSDKILLSGAVRRSDDELKVGLLQKDHPNRRFTAARAIFMGWTSERRLTSRLITQAVTRDQQASRSFAAELLAPIEFIRKQGTLDKNIVSDLALTLNAAPDLVAKHALNNGLQFKMSSNW